MCNKIDLLHICINYEMYRYKVPYLVCNSLCVYFSYRLQIKSHYCSKILISNHQHQYWKRKFWKYIVGKFSNFVSLLSAPVVKGVHDACAFADLSTPPCTFFGAKSWMKMNLHFQQSLFPLRHATNYHRRVWYQIHK